mmetsp:Transcript_13832/g.44254  ORF Transcript_13832/g.44254 Transcript_13832/m.44254 type:complete len:318 (-) Transcript_13832:7-960(-)
MSFTSSSSSSSSQLQSTCPRLLPSAEFPAEFTIGNVPVAADTTTSTAATSPRRDAPISVKQELQFPSTDREHHATTHASQGQEHHTRNSISQHHAERRALPRYQLPGMQLESLVDPGFSTADTVTMNRSHPADGPGFACGRTGQLDAVCDDIMPATTVATASDHLRVSDDEEQASSDRAATTSSKPRIFQRVMTQQKAEEIKRRLEGFQRTYDHSKISIGRFSPAERKLRLERHRQKRLAILSHFILGTNDARQRATHSVRKAISERRPRHRGRFVPTSTPVRATFFSSSSSSTASATHPVWKDTPSAASSPSGSVQ